MIISLVLSIISLILTSILIILLVIYIKRIKFLTGTTHNEVELERFQKEIRGLFDNQLLIYKNINEIQNSTLKLYNDSVLNNISVFASSQKEHLENLERRLDETLNTNELRIVRASDILEKGLEKLQQDNEKKLEQMRQTVDEKLNVSLERRLSESFNLISTRLEAVYKGLGEMQSLAVGVGDLKKVLTNVKTRGVWGEISLNNLLEQILAKEQFVKNAMIKPNSQERVDFAIKLPGKDESEILLPIDSKFPLEDYQRLCDASDRGDINDINEALKSLEKRVKDEAKSIKEKYIYLPYTTDFAIMYLATEGLYAEVVRRSGLVEELQRSCKVILCGPNTLAALLNSLQLGFKTLSIEKRSSEIWNLLGIFKREFENFTQLLAKTQKKLTEATNTIDLAAKKTQTIARKLKNTPLLETSKTDLIEDVFSEITEDIVD